MSNLILAVPSKGRLMEATVETLGDLEHNITRTAAGLVPDNTLDVVARNRDRFQVYALTANRNDERLAQQCVRWSPRYAVMADPDAAERLRARLREAGVPTEILGGCRTWSLLFA